MGRGKRGSKLGCIARARSDDFIIFQKAIDVCFVIFISTFSLRSPGSARPLPSNLPRASLTGLLKGLARCEGPSAVRGMSAEQLTTVLIAIATLWWCAGWPMELWQLGAARLQAVAGIRTGWGFVVARPLVAAADGALRVPTPPQNQASRATPSAWLS